MLSPSFLADYQQVESFILALYLGFFIAVGLYHLVIFFYNREANYLWFSLYCLVSAISAVIMTGYALRFFLAELTALALCLFEADSHNVDVLYFSGLYPILFANQQLDPNLGQSPAFAIWNALIDRGIPLTFFRSRYSVADDGPEPRFTNRFTGGYFSYRTSVFKKGIRPGEVVPAGEYYLSPWDDPEYFGSYPGDPTYHSSQLDTNWQNLATNAVFYQVDDSATRQGEGTGIGLALTRELVKLLGGSIEVSSQVGIGTEFTVLLPITREAEKGTVIDPLSHKLPAGKSQPEAVLALDA